MNRRLFAAALAALAGFGFAAQPSAALAQVVRRHRRRVRRRVRRRIRRRAVTRVVLGRPLWVVPVRLAVGWELVRDNRVVIVKETKVVERAGAKVEVAIVEDDQGKTEQVEILREDTRENGQELEGSTLAASDHTTPGIETEVEEDVGD
jgi:hypothetical protein